MSEDLFGGLVGGTSRSRPAAGGSLADSPNRAGVAAGGPDAAAHAWTRSSGRTTCWLRARRCAGWPPGRRCRSSSGVRRARARRRSPRWSPGRPTRRFVELSAVTAGVKEVRAVLDQARRDLRNGRPTVLFVDEVHRFSKTQQDVLLPAVENRLVTLIAATTENPSFSVISPLLSRSLLLTLRPLTDEDISALLDRAPTARRTAAWPAAYTLEPTRPGRASLRLAGGDARRALTYLEESAAGAAAVDSDRRSTTEIVEQAVDKAAVRYDRDGDQHYDVISAFIKSIRGLGRPGGAALPGPDDRGGGGPAVHRPPAGDPGLGGHRAGRPDRAADRGRGGARGAVHRHAGGPDQPGPGGDRPAPWRPSPTP